MRVFGVSAHQEGDITSKEWSITNPKKGCRCRDHFLSHEGKELKQTVQLLTPPLVSKDHVVPDVLHLFLRMTDVLFNLLALGDRMKLSAAWWNFLQHHR